MQNPNQLCVAIKKKIIWCKEFSSYFLIKSFVFWRHYFQISKSGENDHLMIDWGGSEIILANFKLNYKTSLNSWNVYNLAAILHVLCLFVKKQSKNQITPACCVFLCVIHLSIYPSLSLLTCLIRSFLSALLSMGTSWKVQLSVVLCLISRIQCTRLRKSLQIR